MCLIKDYNTFLSLFLDYVMEYLNYFNQNVVVEGMFCFFAPKK